MPSHLNWADHDPMDCKGKRPPGCGIQDGRGGSQTQRETAKTLARTRSDHKGANVHSVRLPACPTCGVPPNSKTVLEVDVELQEVLSKTRHGKGKPKSSDLERRIREARKSADPWVEIERIRQEHGFPDGWAEMTAGFYGISPL